MVTRGAICQYCSKPIKSGRSDKKFCGSGCKDAYYNAIKSEELKEISKIDGILKRNRRVLKKLFNPRKTDKTVTREEMIRAGFEFGFHTHVAITRLRLNEITFCYDYGYREAKEGVYLLFHSFPEIRVKDGYEVKVTE